MICFARYEERPSLVKCYSGSTSLSARVIPELSLIQLFFINQVEPMNRALKEQNSDSWINGRRRDHGTTVFPNGLSSVISTINSYGTPCVTDLLPRRIR